MSAVSRIDEPRADTHEVTLVPPGSIEMIWGNVWPLLEPAMQRSHGRWNEQSLFESLAVGRMQLWLAFDASTKQIDAAAVTQVMSYPSRRMLAVHWLGGDRFNEWVWEMLDLFERFGSDAGCTGIEATARQGFWKWLSQTDYEKAYVVYEKTIGPKEVP